MRNRFNFELSRLSEKILKMGERVISCVEGKLCMTEVSDDFQEIIQMSYNLILQQQPVSKDLSFITSSRQIASDLLRVAQQAVGVFDMMSGNENDELFSMKKIVLEMLEKIMKVFEDSTKSENDDFLEKNAEKIKNVINMDDELDEIFHNIKGKLASMMVSGGAKEQDAEKALDFMLIAKYYERMGDHVVNVANSVGS